MFRLGPQIDDVVLLGYFVIFVSLALVWERDGEIYGPVESWGQLIGLGLGLVNSMRLFNRASYHHG